MCEQIDFFFLKMDPAFEKRLLRPYNGTSSSPVVRNLFGSGLGPGYSASRSPARNLFGPNTPKSQNVVPGLANRSVRVD